MNDSQPQRVQGLKIVSTSGHSEIRRTAPGSAVMALPGGQQSLTGDSHTLLKAASMAIPDEMPETLSLNDPRMTAAMKVLGCTMEELTAAEPPPPPPKKGDDRSPRKVVAVSPNSTARRKELWERRQKNLLAEVQTVARKLTQKRLMEVLAEKDEVRTTYTGLSTQRPENAEEKLRELRDKSQAEIDRAVDAERLKLIGIQKCSERHEKIQKQVDKQRAEQHEKLVESMKARQAKRDKQAEAIEKNLKDMRKEPWVLGG
eukprot:s1797_g3.t3